MGLIKLDPHKQEWPPKNLRGCLWNNGLHTKPAVDADAITHYHPARPKTNRTKLLKLMKTEKKCRPIQRWKLTGSYQCEWYPPSLGTLRQQLSSNTDPVCSQKIPTPPRNFLFPLDFSCCRSVPGLK